MELRQLRHFLAVAETRNFSRAAERLHIAQPALSISIRKLEEEVGARLFDRGTRDTLLTEAGQMALASARSALAHVDEIGRLAAAVSKGEAGLLRIAFVGGASYRVLPTHLPEFRRRYPAVRLDLLESTSIEIVDNVRSGLIDLGIVRHPLMDATGLATRVVEDDPLVAVVPRGHRLAAKSRLRLQDLAEEPFIQFSKARAPSVNAIIALACRRSGFEPRVAQEALQIQTIISLVESGLGVALVPAAARAGSGQAVEFRPISDHKELLRVGLALVFSATNRKRVVQNFVQTVAP